MPLFSLQPFNTHTPSTVTYVLFLSVGGAVLFPPAQPLGADDAPWPSTSCLHSKSFRFLSVLNKRQDKIQKEAENLNCLLL